MSLTILTVSQLNLYAKTLLEDDDRLRHVFLRGEVSNFNNHYRSGHFYLSIKDENAAIHAVMFRSSAARLRFMPFDGMKIIAVGRVSIYERDGQFQFYIDDLQPEGVGALYLAYEQLRARLAAEGLFDEERKRPLPAFPKTIGVVTSAQGAALQDVLQILARRWPYVRVRLYDVQVQGDGAAEQIAAAVARAGKAHAADVLIVGRGGGSMEDLWAFNDERVARAIAASEIPVVSAVGHETDFTIADFAADLRAPTPSAAAELVSPDQNDVFAAVESLRAGLCRHMREALAKKKASLRSLQSTRAMASPRSALEARRMRLDMVEASFITAARRNGERQRYRLAALAAKLDALSPLKVLRRGYAAAFNEEGRPVMAAAMLHKGEPLSLLFADGVALARVERVEPKPPQQ